MKTLLVAITVTDEWEGTPWDLLDDVTEAEPSGEALANPRFIVLALEMLERAAELVDREARWDHTYGGDIDDLPEVVSSTLGDELRTTAQTIRGAR